MEKLLIDKYGEATAFNTETNSIVPKLDNVNCSLYRASDDGQAISQWQVVDYKKGDIILACSAWAGDKAVVKLAVIDDKAAIHDISEWYKKECDAKEEANAAS